GVRWSEWVSPYTLPSHDEKEHVGSHSREQEQRPVKTRLSGLAAGRGAAWRWAISHSPGFNCGDFTHLGPAGGGVVASRMLPVTAACDVSPIGGRGRRGSMVPNRDSSDLGQLEVSLGRLFLPKNMVGAFHVSGCGR